MNRINLQMILTTILLTAAIITKTAQSNITTEAEDPLYLTLKTNAQKYLLRQKVIIEGNLTQDSSLPADAAIALQIDNPLNTTIAYKTIIIGNPEKMWINQRWPINITTIRLTDLNNNPIDTAKTNNQIKVHVTVYNPQVTQRQVYITVTVYDANMVPIKATGSLDTLGPQQSTTITVYVYLPNWACSGKSIITANVYTKEPKNGGTPLTPEKTKYFCISRVQQGLYQYPELPPPQQQTSPGWFRTEVTLSPEPRAGQYIIYSVAQTSLTLITQTQTTFTVQNSQGYPPQASFVYWPATPYENQTVQFDASSSTPEGYNDAITSYKWNFGDGTPPITETDPYITHKYLNAGTYIITLNVTDSEGLWSITQKPIIILPEFGPTANFTWSPSNPVINENITFDASLSTPGWSKTKGDYSPITQYTWNFGDGTGTIITNQQQIIHKYTEPGNYSVTLTIKDDVGRTNSITKIVQVQNVTLKALDINRNGKIDGMDVTLVCYSFGTVPGMPKWNGACDVDKNGKVDGVDVTLVCRHFGEDP
ncbi:MAG: PKD domain-containing protein [Candidatus Bathyarchaeia archaeon]